MSYTPLGIQQQTVSTTDDTPVNLDFPVATGTYHLFIQASSGTDRKLWEIAVSVKVIAGTATILGTAVDVIAGAGDAGLTTALAVPTANAGNIRCTLTGIAATNIDWTVKVYKFL